MEELLSTEALDREILEDARKKAYRILKAADDAVKAGAAAWEKKTAEAAAEMEGRYALRRERAAAEIMARLPLDKQRLRSEKIEGLLLSAAEDWFSGLDRKQVLSLLEGELGKGLGECPEARDFPRAGVRLRGLDQAEAGVLLKKHLPGLVPVFEKSGAGELPPQGKAGGSQARGQVYPEMILDFPPVRITVSIALAVDSLLRDRRAELVSALLGPEALRGTGPGPAGEGPQGGRDD
jgi:vacuolar-type H+-ATPase subunit E/Vma4